MNTATASSEFVGPGAVLERHTSRRLAGVPTVAVLVGPVGAGVRLWRRWATAEGRGVVAANRNLFPLGWC